MRLKYWLLVSICVLSAELNPGVAGPIFDTQESFEEKSKRIGSWEHLAPVEDIKPAHLQCDGLKDVELGPDEAFYTLEESKETPYFFSESKEGLQRVAGRYNGLHTSEVKEDVEVYSRYSSSDSQLPILRKNPASESSSSEESESDSEEEGVAPPRFFDVKKYLITPQESKA